MVEPMLPAGLGWSVQKKVILSIRISFHSADSIYKVTGIARKYLHLFVLTVSSAGTGLFISKCGLFFHSSVYSLSTAFFLGYLLIVLLFIGL